MKRLKVVEKGRLGVERKGGKMGRAVGRRRYRRTESREGGKTRQTGGRSRFFELDAIPRGSTEYTGTPDEEEPLPRFVMFPCFPLEPVLILPLRTRGKKKDWSSTSRNMHPDSSRKAPVGRIGGAVFVSGREATAFTGKKRKNNTKGLRVLLPTAPPPPLSARCVSAFVLSPSSLWGSWVYHSPLWRSARGNPHPEPAMGRREHERARIPPSFRYDFIGHWGRVFLGAPVSCKIQCWRHVKHAALRSAPGHVGRHSCAVASRS